MTTTMNKCSVSLNTADIAEERCVAHLMPCSIHLNGPASVSKYFQPVVSRSTHNESDDILEASFRGRPLQGRVVELPSDYVGIVLKKEDNKGPQGDTAEDRNDENQRWTPIHQFDKFTYWNWDKQPSANDTVVKALDWLEIAKVIHEPARKKDDS